MDQANRLRSMAKGTNIENKTQTARTITITSGKGGVGKTNFSVNLALYFAKKGYRTLIIDADLGLANIEIILSANPRYSLLNLFESQISIEEIITKSSYGVSFISGGSGFSELANIGKSHIRHILQNMEILDELFDFIIIDTGAGINEIVINFIKASSETIFIIAPEPTSITDAYSLMKTIKGETSEEIIKYKIVVNRVEDKKEGEMVFKNLSRVASRFLGAELSFLGAIPYDTSLVKAVKQQKPILNLYPNSKFSAEMENIGGALLNITEKTGSMQIFMKKLAGIFSK